MKLPNLGEQKKIDGIKREWWFSGGFQRGIKSNCGKGLRKNAVELKMLNELKTVNKNFGLQQFD